MLHNDKVLSECIDNIDFVNNIVEFPFIPSSNDPIIAIAPTQITTVAVTNASLNLSFSSIFLLFGYKININN